MIERRYLSIGEVLGLLLEEFPDVTISKIRFLESQGLIEPERTPSGYRKFYDEDVEMLRVILREQRENFLPLKVIKDRLDTGEIPRPIDPTPTGSIRLPRSASRSAGGPPPLAAAPTGPGLRAPQRPNDSSPAARTPAEVRTPRIEVSDDPIRPGDDPTGEVDPAEEAASRSSHPAARAGAPRAETGLTADELCAQAGVDVAFLDELESFGLVSAGRVGGWRTYDADSIRAVHAAAQLCARGLEPRHLRLWRQIVDKEMALIEQLVLPLLRQRNPIARDQAGSLAMEIERLGEELRAALASKALRHLIG